MRQLISGPSLKTDFGQTRERKTEEGEKGKEKGLDSKDTLLASHLSVLSFSTCVRHDPPLFISPPRLDSIFLSDSHQDDMDGGFLGKDQIGTACGGGRERSEARSDSNHSIPSSSQAGSTLVGHRISRTSTWKSP